MDNVYQVAQQVRTQLTLGTYTLTSGDVVPAIWLDTPDSSGQALDIIRVSGLECVITHPYHSRPIVHTSGCNGLWQLYQLLFTQYDTSITLRPLIKTVASWGLTLKEIVHVPKYDIQDQFETLSFVGVGRI